MTPRTYITNEERARIKQLTRSGHTNEHIAKIIGQTVEWVDQVQHGMAWQSGEDNETLER